MDWGKIAEFFRLEAVAVYIVALVGWAIVGYQAWKSRQGRHVVCTVIQRPFSHLTLSHMARERVTVEFTAEGRAHPIRIGALSQVVIDIKNDSAVDALNDIELEFRTPGARVLDVGWTRDTPRYLCKKSQLWWPRIDESSVEEGEPVEPSSRVLVSLSHLPSWEKHHHPVGVVILADGELESIGMDRQGSKAGVPPNEVWTAKFVNFKEFEIKELITGVRSVILQTMALGLTFMILGWLTLRVLGPIFLGSNAFRASHLVFLFGYVFGFLFSGVLGFFLQRRRIAAVMRQGSQDQGPV